MMDLAIIKNDGNAYLIESNGMLVKDIHEQMLDKKVIAIKIGKNVFSKHSLVCVMTKECADKTLEHNLYIQILNNEVRCTVPNLDIALKGIVDDVNSLSYVLVNDCITFNKQGFQLAQENINE